MRKRLEKPLAFALSCLLIALIEVVVRHHLAGHGDPLERAWLLLRPDRQWGWQQREALSTLFYGKQVTTDALGLRAKPAPPESGGLRIVVAGPSSAFGWGVADDETYAAALERELADRKARVVNAGQIGFSLPQGLIFLEKSDVLREHPPDVLVWAYGLNDLDRRRFFYQNPEPDLVHFAAAPPRLGFAITRLSNHLLLVPWLSKRLLGALAGDARCRSLPATQIRVPPADFEKSLDAAIALTRRVGARGVFLTTAATYRTHAAAESGNDRCAAFKLEEETRLAGGIARYNELVAAHARRGELAVLEIGKLVDTSLGSPDFVDRVHFSMGGHQKIAKALADEIRRLDAAVKP